MERELSAALLPVTGQALRAGSAPLDKLKTKRDTTTSRQLVMRMSDLIVLCWLGVQAHRRPWVSRGWVRTYC
jgi:hypothetical protein